METPKRFLHNRLVLLLLTVNSFLVLLTTVLILLRLGGGRSDGYFIQYRSNLGLNAYKVGGYSNLLAFIVFAIFVMAFHTVVSHRLYHQRRHASLVILALGTLLLGLTLVVSNALLVLR